MRVFLVEYSSAGNFERGSISIEAENLVQAQDKFFAYLKTLDLYSHMWNLSMSMREISGHL